MTGKAPPQPSTAASDDNDHSAVKHDLTMIFTEGDMRNQAPRLQALHLLEHLEARGWELVKRDARSLHPDPDSWLEFVNVNEGLLADGIATSRTRTSSAIAELGLDPSEVRAVVIETNVVHVYRWSNKPKRQTLPIIEAEEYMP